MENSKSDRLRFDFPDSASQPCNSSSPELLNDATNQVCSQNIMKFVCRLMELLATIVT